MIIFADQCIPRDMITALKNAGFKVTCAGDIHLSRADDSQIFSYAARHGHVLLTVDKDFGNILRFDIRRSNGVIIVYVEDFSIRDEILTSTVHFFKKFSWPRIKGRLFIIEKGQIRTWP